MNNLEQKIQKLERWLKESEKHIAYLENQIGIRDESIILLKTEVGNLKPRLKKALQDIENKDKIIPALESQLIEMTSEISSLRYRIQKLRETMTLDMTHLPSTNTPVFDLIKDVRTNIKLLADSARGDDTLIIDEINNLQTQTELKLTKIQNGCYTFENEVTQLRQEVINLKDINRNQQELTNELGTLNETLKEQIDDLTDKNETIQIEIEEKTRLYEQSQDRLDECREENYHLSQSLEGAHEDITESELVHDKLNQKLRILGLTHIAWRARNLRQAQILNVEFNTARTAWRNQRDRNRHIARELQNCRRHGRNLQNDKVLIEFWRDRIILRYEKWKNKTHGVRQIINNLNQQIFALQNNPLVNPLNMAAIQDVTSALAPMIAQIPMYIGQEPPDEYYNKFMQVFQYGNTLGVVGFNDAVKTRMLTSRLAERFTPPNPFQNSAGNQIVTPTLFLGWLQEKYREVMIGTSQASMKVLINEKFSPLDTPDNI
ncbi:hypothetical protein Glove_245g35 [Diversispora epigaea]|uniref:Uncharacterized protein n=1 Tax=Diversispora epigaea TaxID=1348612 RepID=A0A397IFF4_9GLOM|nr:hypothetical protein Glove_245g35 [Diversispora epigaea]